MILPRWSRPDPPTLQVVRHLRECPGCGLFQRLPDLASGQLARCVRCQCRLERLTAHPGFYTPIALAISSVVFYLLAITMPLMTFDVYGRSRTITLFTGPLELIREGWAPVGVLVMLGTIIFPAIVIGLLLPVATMIARGQIVPPAPKLLRWYIHLRSWSMVEVYSLGVLVAYSKLIDLARVEIGVAIYAIAGLMLTMAMTDCTLRSDLVWRRHHMDADDGSTEPEMPPVNRLIACTVCGLVCSAAEPLQSDAPAGPCLRCGQTLRCRKPDSLRRSLALLTAATICYVPANLFPIMTIIKLYRGGGHTIVEGVIELYVDGMLPLALLVFFASITVPVLKILSIAIMLLGTWRGSALCLVDRSRLYWIVDFIGRWSMIDVFMVSILVGLVQFNALGNITANAGIEAFATVVVLTIFAAEAFDPRLMWDAAGFNGVHLAARRSLKAASRQPAAGKSGAGKAATA